MKYIAVIFLHAAFAGMLYSQSVGTIKNIQRELEFATIQNPIDKIYALLAEGKYDLAKTEALERIKGHPENFHLNMILAQIAEHEKNHDHVIKYTSMVISKPGTNGVALSMRAFAHKHKGENEQALSDLKEALKDESISNEFKQNVSLNIGEIEQMFIRQEEQAVKERQLKSAQEELDRKTAEYQKREEQYLQEQARINQPDHAKKEAPWQKPAQPEPRNKAFTCYNEKKFAEAEKLVQEVLNDHPEDFQMNLLMAATCHAQAKWRETLQYANKVLTINPEHSYAIVLRGYAHKHLKQHQEALLDFKKALLQPGISPESCNTMNAEIAWISAYDQLTALTEAEAILKQAELAIAKNDTQQAFQSLRRLMASSATEPIKNRANFLLACVNWKEGKYDAAFKQFSALSNKLETAYGRSECFAKMAEFHQKNHHTALAVHFAKKSAELMPDSKIRNLQLAYLLVAADRDREATCYFEKAFKSNDAIATPNKAFLDSAYAHKRIGDNEKAQTYLMSFVDSLNMHDTLSREEIAMLFYSRREYADLERKLGSYTLFQYQQTRENYMMLGIQELYYRPYYENGKFLEVYGNFVANLASDLYAHGWETAYSILGVRVSPFADYNFVVGIEEIFKIGNLGLNNDTRLRLDYSWNVGFDINPVEYHWKYAMFFTEFTQSFKRNERTFASEIRYGRNFKANCLLKNLTVAPHLFYYADYNNLDFYTRGQWRSYAGPGVHIRQWYRESKYAAPQSYLDLTIQYRISFLKREEHALFISIFHSF